MYIYDSQIVHHSPCFNLFILHNCYLVIKKLKSIKTTFFYVSTYVFYENFFPTFIYFYFLLLYIVYRYSVKL